MFGRKINLEIRKETYYLWCNRIFDMKVMYNAKEFSKALKTKRIIDLNIDLRAAAKRTKISISTLSRIENGKMPDLNTFANLCEWMGKDMNEFIVIKSSKK